MATDEFGNLVADVGEFDPYAHPNPALAALENMPGMTQAAGFTAFRGSNTILKGGWADRSRRVGNRPIKPGGMLRNNSPRPRSWTRYGSQDIFYEGAGAKKYTPFAAGAGLVNVAAKHGALGAEVGRWSAASAASELDGKGRVMGRGALSQIMAAERVGQKKVVSKKMQASVASYLAKGGTVATAAEMADPMMARNAIYGSMQKPLGQYVGGYMSALRDPMTGHWASQSGAGSHMGEHFSRGARASTSALRAGGLEAGQKIGMRAAGHGIATAYRGGIAKAGAKQLTGMAAKKVGMSAAAKTGAAVGLRAVGLAIPYVNIAVALWTAYDIGKMITTGVVPGAARMATDAYKSYTGQSQQRMFGGSGFKISEAAVTSRQRGVMAIQNSRLNARSALGSEAGGMAAHFG